RPGSALVPYTTLFRSGHLGQAYYGFRRYVDYPPGLRWRVHDVPKVMQAGRRWADEHDQSGALQFADQAADADGCDLLITTGALRSEEHTSELQSRENL